MVGCFIYSANAQSDYWAPYVEGVGEYDFLNDSGAKGGVRVFVPFAQQQDQLWYLNPNLFVAEGRSYSGHLALGHRRLITNTDQDSKEADKYILGGFAYLGGFESSFDNEFYYVGVGAEAISENFDAIINITSPFADERDTNSSVSVELPAEPAIALGGDFFVIDDDGDGEFHDLRFAEGAQQGSATERALSGVDIELARRFYFHKSEYDKDHIRIFANHGHYFGHRKSDQDRTALGIEFFDLGRYQYTGRNDRPYEFIVGARYE